MTTQTLNTAKPAPAAVPDERSHLIALLGVMCGWFEDLAKIAGWTPDNANAAWAGYRAAKAAIAPSQPAPAAVPDEAFNIIEGIRAELTWGGWRKTSSRDWVMDSLSELLSMLTAAPQPAEQQPVCPTCPTCYGRGWDMDCQNEFRPATCPDCAGSGKAEHSITVQESDVERRK